MERLERLVNLVAILLDTSRPLTASELRLRVPGYPDGGANFKRTFERDKAALREMGIPIDVVDIEPSNPDTDQGYLIRRDRYEFPDPGLTPEEVAALHLAATQVQVNGNDVSAALWKLGGVPEDIAVDGAPAVPAPAALPGGLYLEEVFAAAAERRTLRFDYRDEPRVVDPWRVEYRNGAWYVAGLDHARGERRTFRLDRISSRPESGPPAAFTSPEHTSPVWTHPWEMGDEEPVVVEVLVDADQVPWATTDAGSGLDGTRQPDGSTVLRLRVTNRAALRSWVLGFLDHAEIVGPPQERSAMISWLDAAGMSGDDA